MKSLIFALSIVEQIRINTERKLWRRKKKEEMKKEKEYLDSVLEGYRIRIEALYDPQYLGCISKIQEQRKRLVTQIDSLLDAHNERVQSLEDLNLVKEIEMIKKRRNELKEKVLSMTARRVSSGSASGTSGVTNEDESNGNKPKESEVQIEILFENVRTPTLMVECGICKRFIDDESSGQHYQFSH